MSNLVEMVARGAVPDRASHILEGIVASIHRANGLSDARIDADDALDQFRMGRLQLLGVLIELEDEFYIEFPVDAVDRFRRVGDIALYIQSHEMAPDDDVPAECASALTIWGRSARNLLHQACVRVFSNPFKSAGLAS
jgi:acyl carrier protein